MQISALEMSILAFIVSLASLAVSYRTYRFNTRPNLQLGSEKQDFTVQAVNLGPRPVLIRTMITTRLGSEMLATPNRVDMLAKTNDALDLHFSGILDRPYAAATVELECIHATSDRPFKRYMLVVIRMSGKVDVVIQTGRRPRWLRSNRHARLALHGSGYPKDALEIALS